MTEFEQKVVNAGAGQRPDSEIAKELGCAKRAICRIRNKLKIEKFGGLYLTQEGESCRSICEAMYDAWLHDNGILHEHEIRFPDLGVVADFRVNDEIVEVVGMIGYPKYDRRLAEKKQIYLDNNIKVRYIDSVEVTKLYATSGIAVKVSAERVCKCCGKHTADLVKRLCREKCYMQMWRQNQDKVACKNCGCDFPQSDMESKFCSRKCYWESLKQELPSEEWFIEQSETKSLRSLAIEFGVEPNMLYMRIRRWKERNRQ